MKSFTDIEQSKKLAEILPIESADMWWAERYEGHTTMDYQYVVEETPYYYLSLKKPSIDNYSQDTVKDIPCWSLAALLSVIPKYIEDLNRLRIDIDNVDFSIWYDDLNGYGVNDKLPDITLKEPVDACYEMILKLHEQNLI